MSAFKTHFYRKTSEPLVGIGKKENIKHAKKLENWFTFEFFSSFRHNYFVVGLSKAAHNLRS